MATKRIMPSGHLQVGSKQWILVFPYGKMDDGRFQFEVVSPKRIADRTDVDELVYPEPYTLEVYGEWFIEYDITKPILVQVPDDVEDGN